MKRKQYLGTAVSARLLFGAVVLNAVLFMNGCGENERIDGPQPVDPKVEPMKRAEITPTVEPALELTGEADDVYDIEQVYPDVVFRTIVEGSITPVTVTYGLGGEGGYVSAISDDEEMISGFVEAFRELTIDNVNVDPETGWYTADGGEDIIFGLADGSEMEIALDGRTRIHTDDAVYELGNTQKLSEMCVLMQEMAYLNEADGLPKGDPVAVFHGGVGERTVETYVYETDAGYKYFHVVSTTVVWGSTEWNHEVTKIGMAATKEEVMDKAAEHGADSFVTFPNDLEAHKIEEFLNADE